MSFTGKELIRLGFLSCFVVFFTFLTGSIDLAIPFLMILYFYNKNINKILFYLFISASICFSFTILFSKIGIISSSEMLRKTEGDIIVRSSLGFEHVNHVFTHWFSIILLYYYLFGIRIKSFVFFIVTSYYFFIETDCRTGFYCTVLFLIIQFFISEKIIKKIKKSSYLFFPLMFFISIFFAIQFGNINNPVDVLVSGRFSIWNYCINNMNIFSLFGNQIPIVISIDNFYMNMLFSYGVIVFLNYMFIHSYTMPKITDYKHFTVIIFFMFYCLFEANYLYYVNFSFIIIFYYYVKNNKNKEYKIK
ncbi:hypothetical protein GMC59_13145 [Turicibacter sanguinis]|nr:hypothetical protein [Turicibacter sanguinis]MTP65178.1 hypothetical protein [Turicibacter sanguinis]MTP69348.1 hypothetical protein [Turicibacter sanguinis]